MVIAALPMLAAAMLQPLQPACDGLLAAAAPVRRAVLPVRVVGAADIVRLRDFGPLGAGAGDEAFIAVTADGRRAALQLRRADPVTNSYCLGLVVIDLASGKAQVIDTGGELVRPTYVHNGLAGYPMGIPTPIMPHWSSDGRWLLLLKRMNGVTQAWRVRDDGSQREQLTHEAQDVTAATWSADGRRLIFRTDRRQTQAQAAIEAEGRGGWHYDERSMPGSTPRPYPRPTVPEVFDLDLATRAVADAGPDDRELLISRGSTSAAVLVRPDGTTIHAAKVSRDPVAYQSPQMIRWRAGGDERTCSDDPCAAAQAFWIEPGGDTVLLLARSGWGRGDMSFYRWAVRTGRLTRLSTTSDLLLGCRLYERHVLCARESSTRPRRLALIDPVTGKSRIVFNPNRDYDRLSTGGVDRLNLISANGTQSFADVMVPPAFVPGRHYPLVVVQYESRGFLRGGTGEEYPIPALASAGMIVLSFQRPLDVAVTATPPPASGDDFNRIDLADWADRRNVHSALMTALDRIIARGWVDERRIGITGLSDGIGTAAFALLHSHRFAVAALSGCCEEPVSDQILQGPEFARILSAAGYPPLTRPDPAYWAPYSLAQHASTLAAPLLIQAPDREFLFSLPTLAALREHGAAVDLYVFPGEFHVIWQPTHRAAIFERTLRWFEFWFGLPPLADQQPAPPDEMKRWQALRERRQVTPRPTPDHP